MKLLLLFVSLLFSSLGFAQGDACLKKLKNLLETKSEFYLLKSNASVFDIFQLSCEDGDFGNALHNYGAFAFIHEAAHFEDLGWDEEGFPNSLDEFNYFTIDGEHLGNFENYKSLPKVRDIVIPYIEKEKPEFLEADSAFMSMHDGYIADEEALASKVIHGLASELNGYTHGARIQARILPLLPNSVTFTDDLGNQHSMDSPYAKIPSQLDGVMYFIYNFNLYLRLLKQNHPEVWSDFYTTHNKDYLRKVLTPSVKILNELDHCSIREIYFNVDFYVEELIKDDTHILSEILGDKLFEDLICAEDGIRRGLKMIDGESIIPSKSLGECK